MSQDFHIGVSIVVGKAIIPHTHVGRETRDP